MWDYGFMVACFAILVIFLVYYLINPRIPIRLNKTYVQLLLIETLFIPFEILVTYLNESFAAVPTTLLHVLNMALLMMSLVRILWFFRFTVNFLKLKPRTSPAKTFFALVVFFISASAIILNPWGNGLFRIDGDGYHTGPLFNIMIYFCLSFYVFLSILLLLVHMEKWHRRKYFGALAYNVALLIGVVTSMFSQRQGIFNIFCLIALIIIYLSFENPDFYMSSRGSVFNLEALRAMLDDLVGKSYFLIMGVVLHNYTEERGIYGGARMDATLAEISRFLARSFPRQRVFYLRNGQFAILGGDLMSWDRLRDEISARFRYPWGDSDSEVYLNVSFIRADSSIRLRTAEELVDHLLLQFDEVGRSVDQSRVVDLDASAVDSLDRQITVKHYLDNAVEHGKVEVFLQPIIEGATGNVVGAEALARIRDLSGETVSPNEFIPIAEKSGRIDRLGDQVFEKVCRIAADPGIKSVGLSFINVNISPVQCLKRDLAKKLMAVVNRYEVPSDFIHLELTEQSMGEYSVMKREIDSLCSCGFRFVLDDYGTGYSNLARFNRYPFINIKIDMEVVAAHFSDNDTLLPTLIKAFKEMDYTVTAEGVETKQMADVLIATGCDYLQGFYYSEPLPVNEFVEKYGLGAKKAQ